MIYQQTLFPKLCKMHYYAYKYQSTHNIVWKIDFKIERWLSRSLTNSLNSTVLPSHLTSWTEERGAIVLQRITRCDWVCSSNCLSSAPTLTWQGCHWLRYLYNVQCKEQISNINKHYYISRTILFCLKASQTKIRDGPHIMVSNVSWHVWDLSWDRFLVI